MHSDSTTSALDDLLRRLTAARHVFWEWMQAMLESYACWTYVAQVVETQSLARTSKTPCPTKTIRKCGIFESQR
eukprot:4935337-Amphidinium_carterae.1